MANYITHWWHSRQLEVTGLACAIYLPERFGEGKRRATERGHNIELYKKMI